MSGYVDIHTHVLPGIDDGPADLEGALAMLRAAADAGTETLVATPHLRSDFPGVRVHELAARCQRLREAIQHEGIAIRVVCGAEVSLVWALEATDEDIALATYDQQGSDLLIETPAPSTAGLDTLLYRLRAKELRITLAHPERSPEFQTDDTRLREVARQGVLLQLNAESLLDAKRRSGIGQLAERLCREGLVHALASDGHRSETWRPVTSLAPGTRAAALLVGAERADWMAQAAPTAIITGEDLPDPPSILTPQRKGRRLWRG